MNIIRFAFQNLLRHKRRTIITSSALAIGIISYVFTDSLVQGGAEESIRNFRRYGTGDSTIIHRAFWDDREKLRLEHLVDNATDITQRLTEAEISATARTRVAAELIVYKDPYPEDGSLQAVIYAVDAADRGAVFDYAEHISTGVYLDPNSNRAEIVLGGWIAEDIGADIDYPITISTRTREGYRQTFDAVVVGIANTPDPIINRTAVFLSMHQADDLLQLNGAATEIALPRLTAAESVRADEIVAAYSQLERVRFERLIGDFLEFAQSENAGNQIVLFVVFIIAAVGISNTMLMATLERKREIGMLQAIGMSRAQIKRMMLAEAGALGAIGGAIGVMLGALANIPLVNNGIDYSMWLRDYNLGYRVAGVFYGTWKIDTFVSAFLLAVIISVITAYLPVRRILRANTITACLRA